ncbi:MAG: hypothetical protein QM523_02340 [Candidatus Pacebacteria bacterium]|nr:hypothetical protein [Candidatus Paceibacterota bacterium]
MAEFKLLPPQIPNLGNSGTLLGRLEQLTSDRRKIGYWIGGIFFYLWFASLVVGLSWWRSAIFCAVVLLLAVASLSYYLRLQSTVAEDGLGRSLLTAVAGFTGFMWVMILVIPAIAWLSILLYGLSSIPAWLTR